MILQAVYFKLRFTLGYRDLIGLMALRGVKVDHSTIQQWVFKFSKEVESNMYKRKQAVCNSWRMYQTFIKVERVWTDIYIEWLINMAKPLIFY